MTAYLRISLAVLASALLALTGQGLAMSRGVSASVGQMVICTGTGPVMVHVDEDGQPTRPPHYCPDYVLSLLGALDVIEIAPDARPSATTDQPRLSETQVVHFGARNTLARAPPMAV
ncbi:hypothetical protein Q5Y75_24070 [Ruegeria sp. 2205SS24-7]|uniref:hypothetical protein n=1 Tax=Ruegeria discodermiae TaxID=3064389 RepID=UPI0027414326|nr:hypothetical protein [Ruegeria sp. 2205SS24-7]MDP5220272.1 hypothetical protein [Ruegeria sp. 2205SS24-7]